MDGMQITSVDARAYSRYCESTTGGSSPSCTVTPQLSHWMISSASSLLSPRHTQQIRMCSILWELQVWAASSEGSCHKPGKQQQEQTSEPQCTAPPPVTPDALTTHSALGIRQIPSTMMMDTALSRLAERAQGLSSRDCPRYHPNFHRDYEWTTFVPRLIVCLLLCGAKQSSLRRSHNTSLSSFAVDWVGKKRENIWEEHANLAGDLLK